MKMLQIIGKCAEKNKIVGFQFLDQENRYVAVGSFNPGPMDEAGGGKDDNTAKGGFYVAPSFKCRCCGKKYIYQCGYCGTMICYDGLARQDVVCPECGKKSDVPAVDVQGTIMSSGVKRTVRSDIVLAVDTSGSMLKYDQNGRLTACVGSRLHEVREAAVNDFINVYRDKCRMALVCFDSNVRLVTPLTSDVDKVKEDLLAYKDSGGTESPLPMILSDLRLDEFRQSQSPRYLVVFTDGSWDRRSSEDVKDADKLKRMGITIIAIGCAGADTAFLRSIASPNASITVQDGSISAGFVTAVKFISGQK